MDCRITDPPGMKLHWSCFLANTNHFHKNLYSHKLRLILHVQASNKTSWPVAWYVTATHLSTSSKLFAKVIGELRHFTYLSTQSPFTTGPSLSLSLSLSNKKWVSQTTTQYLIQSSERYLSSFRTGSRTKIHLGQKNNNRDGIDSMDRHHRCQHLL